MSEARFSAPSALVDQLTECAHTRSDRVALIAPEGASTYADLLESSGRVAGALLGGQLDMKATRVATLVPPGSSWTATALGVWRAGGVLVPLPLTAPAPELGQVLGDSQPEVVIAADELVRDVAGPASDNRVVVRRVGELLATEAPAHLPVIPPNRDALMLYTSGTTGRPKGVVHTHGGLASQVGSLHEAWGWRRDDHVLLVLPLHHVHGIVNVLVCALAAGARCTIHPKFESIAVWEALANDNLTLFMGVPTIYARLADEHARADAATGKGWAAGARRLRLHVSGSAALPVQLHERWEELTGHRLLERYGMTEIGMALSSLVDGGRWPGHVGWPLPYVEVRVTDDGGAVLSAGEAGELQVRGPLLFREYWRRPEETAEAFTADGWFRTGDEVVEMSRGFRILGRQSVDILKSGGEKVSALEVEEMLRTHPEIAECAVVGVPDEEWGERICAAVVAGPGHTPDPTALRAWARKQLSPWKVPREIRAVTELPRNALGKVVKPRVRGLFG